MAYSNGPFGPGGYSAPGGPPPLTGGPWGPAPGGFPPPPPPPPKKSNTALIVVLVLAVVFVFPMIAGVAIYMLRSRSSERVTDNSDPVPLPPSDPAEPAPQSGGAANAPVVPPGGYRAVRGAGYSYAVPAAWEELDPATLGSPMITHAQRAPVPVGNFATNVNIAGEPYSGDGPGYGAANLVELRKVATIRDQRAATSGSRAAWDIEGYWPNSNGVAYVTLQRYVTNGFKGYVITCSTGAAVFASQRPMCEAVLNSFRVD